MQTNPHKWKKYSLDDADISDRTNASAAFAFLAEMERRKDSEDDQDAAAMDTDANESSSSSGSILFKKQSNRSKEWQKPSFNKSVAVRKQLECSDSASNATVTSDRPTLKGSKVIMPEYVIGKKTASTKAKKTKLDISGDGLVDAKKSNKQQTQTPHLQHLFDEEEDAENDDDDDDDEMNND